MFNTAFHTVISRGELPALTAAIVAAERTSLNGHRLKPTRQLLQTPRVSKSNGLQYYCRCYLVCFDDQLNKIFSYISILVVEKRGCKSKVAHSSSAANTVNVFVHVRRQIEIDDVLDVGNVEPSCGNLFEENYQLEQYLDSFRALEAVEARAFYKVSTREND
jgi:hypothetical protein